MKIYEALYCCCIHESSYATLSLHRTREGAEKAVEASKNEHKLEAKKDEENFKAAGLSASNFSWDFCKAWSIAETELLD